MFSNFYKRKLIIKNIIIIVLYFLIFQIYFV